MQSKHGVVATAILIVAVLASGSARADGSASTIAASASGGLTLQGLDSQDRHLHGGPPALLSAARFHVMNTGPDAIELTVSHVDFLTGRSCEEPPAEVQSEPAFGGLFAAELGMTESARTLTIEPGASFDLDVGFAFVEAYYVFCDRFAFRVTFQAGDEVLVAVAETEVTRVEPLREEPR